VISLQTEKLTQTSEICNMWTAKWQQRVE